MFLAATRRGAVACAHAAKRGTNEWKMKLLPVAQLAESAAKRDNCPSNNSSSSMLPKGGRGSVKPANIAGKNTALLIPNVSSRSMESGSSCCCCCSYACCAPATPPPLLRHAVVVVVIPLITLSLHLFLRSLTAPAVSLANSLATFSYYFLFCRVEASPPRPPLPLLLPPWLAPPGTLQRMRCVRLLLPEK